MTIQTEPIPTTYTAFQGAQRIATGALMQVAALIKEHFREGAVNGILIFNDTSCHLVDVDFRGTISDVQQRLVHTIAQSEVVVASPEPEAEAPRGPGRPKLGVVAREVTLLPRHWDWLNTQTGGASVALRKLVEEARRSGIGRDRIRLAQEASYRFMSAALGGEANYEEVSRALFAGNRLQFNALIETWPVDLKEYLKKVAEGAFQEPAKIETT